MVEYGLNAPYDVSLLIDALFHAIDVRREDEGNDSGREQDHIEAP